MRLDALVAVGIVVFGCTAYTDSGSATSVAQPTAGLVVRAEELGPTSLKIMLLNSGDEPVAVSDTFGYHTFITLEITTSSGAVPYPVESEFFDSSPGYRCLRPGRVLERTVNLLDWEIVLDGQGSGERFAFALPPGQALHVRAFYENGLTKARCSLPEGKHVSNQVTLAGPSSQSVGLVP